jgi:hypothetical protein
MNCTKWILVGCLVLFVSAPTFAQTQQPSGARPGPSHKYRTILTIAGGAGGFAAGVYGGIAAFDDDVYSDRKVWTTAIVSGAGGAVGGYFIGRILDRNRDRANLELFNRRVELSPVLTKDVKGVNISLKF